jgi:alpha(1,3/1,4) fucosyltransferase
LYSQRKAAIDFFERYAPQNFDFFGFGWPSTNYKTYKGIANNKTNTLKNYKFSICYENICNIHGYITEKIFGSFVAGCVPIYWGAEDVTDYIPKNCFIDKRNFKTLHDLYSFISAMKQDEYDAYIENIKRFLKSEQAHYFSIENFMYTLTRAAHFSF